MKKHYNSPLAACFIVLVFVFCSSCKGKKINYGAIHIYNSEEAKKIFDNALKIDSVGKPTVQVLENRIDSNKTLVQTTTTQTFLVYVGRTKDNHLIPKPQVEPSQVAAMLVDEGPIVIGASCTMTCTKTGPDNCSGADGCRPDHRGGCSSFNCGSGCITVNCAPGFAGFGFGEAVIF